MMTKSRIAVLMTCFNREELTRRCIRSLFESVQEEDPFTVEYYVVNDGCTDGTGDMLRSEFPFVNEIIGDGNLFWNGGMHLAFSEAVKKDFDFYLWVNDDVEFVDHAIRKLVNAYSALGSTGNIVVGYTQSSEGECTYGGLAVISGFIPLKVKSIEPQVDMIKCDSMHGNCVLIDKYVVKGIGITDPYYQHGFGDVDYGLTATQNGFSVWMTGFPIGICEKNPLSNLKNVYSGKNLIERFRIMNNFKHKPYKDWKYYTRKFGGKKWVLRFLAPYVKLVLNKF